MCSFLFVIWFITVCQSKNGRVIFLMPRQLALRKRSSEQQRKTISDVQQAHNIMRWYYTKHKSIMLPDIHLILWYIWWTYLEKIVIVIANMLSTSRNQEGFQDHHLHPMMLDDVRVRMQPPQPRVTSHSKTVLKTRRSPKKSNAY